MSEIANSLREEMEGATRALITRNLDGIMRELTDSDESALTVGFSLRLSLNKRRVAGTGAISYSRKFRDELEFITPDPDQRPLPLEDGGDK